ncbi:MAG: hypothetical protein DMG97_18810 [Acidobacteria bacterium]|nr:MAG: hypothetical protein DMG97_18810 [Acidobacteriota bacterium]PYV72664.1 MAG: hypothetical protein DMG96_25385 [Acidobacteriota bacterium]
MTPSPGIHADKRGSDLLTQTWKSTLQAPFDMVTIAHLNTHKKLDKSGFDFALSVSPCSVVKYYLCFDHCSCQVKYRYFHATTCLR